MRKPPIWCRIEAPYSHLKIVSDTSIISHVGDFYKIERVARFWACVSQALTKMVG